LYWAASKCHRLLDNDDDDDDDNDVLFRGAAVTRSMSTTDARRNDVVGVVLVCCMTTMPLSLFPQHTHRQTLTGCEERLINELFSVEKP